MNIERSVTPALSIHSDHGHRSTRFFDHFPRIVAAYIVLSVLVPPSPVTAIDIVMRFNAAQSESFTADPNATGLMSLFNFAEAYYEDIFEDSDHTLEIDFWYEDLEDFAGLHNFVDDADDRETAATIRIDTRNGLGGAERDWFIDPTPADNSEFDMRQSLWRDIPTSTQQDFYNTTAPADVPATFEIGYQGVAVSPLAASRGDMLSTVLHEVGHAIGMSSGNPATRSEVMPDGDYDFDPAYIFGVDLAVEAADSIDDDDGTLIPNGNIAHLGNDRALMFPSRSAGTRRLPSHTDLFAMGSVNNYQQLDVPRREMYGGGSWHNAENWSGAAVPRSGSDTFVRHGETATLAEDAVIRDLRRG